MKKINIVKISISFITILLVGTCCYTIVGSSNEKNSDATVKILKKSDSSTQTFSKEKQKTTDDLGASIVTVQPSRLPQTSEAQIAYLARAGIVLMSLIAMCLNIIIWFPTR